MGILRGIWHRTWDVIWELQKHDISYFAGAVAFFAFFSLFPVLLLAASAGGYVLGQSPSWVRDGFSYLYDQIPYAADFVRGNLQAIREARGSLGFIAVVALIWSASGILRGLETGFNYVWGVEENRSWWHNSLVGIGMLFLLFVLVMLYMATAAGFILMGTRFAARHPWLPVWLFEYTLTTTLTSVILNWLVFVILYKLVPNKQIAFRDVWAGALLTAVLLEMVKAFFTWYSRNYANFELVYGHIGMVMALLLWIYIAAQIVFIGLVYAVVEVRDRQERERLRMATEPPPLPEPGEEQRTETGLL